MIKNFITQTALFLFLISAPYAMEALEKDLPEGNLLIQLLVPEEKIPGIKEQVGLDKIDKNYHCKYMHVSLLTIKDQNSVIRENFSEFIEEFNGVFKQLSASLVFKGSKIECFQSEQNKKYYWSLQGEKTDKLMEACGYLKKFAELFIKRKLKANNNPGMEFSKGFPHMSVACTLNEGDIKKYSLKDTCAQLKIDGFKFIYSFGDGKEIKFPQIFVEKRIDNPLYRTLSHFEFSKGMHDINAGDILNSKNADDEILSIKKRVENNNKKIEMLKNMIEEGKKEIKIKENEKKKNENNENNEARPLINHNNQVINQIMPQNNDRQSGNKKRKHENIN